jgi:CPA1 family monovalent cation:H+ antiporter
LRLSRGRGVPYPSLLALAGAGVAALPFVPQIEIDGRLALPLFIAPALLDAAFDLAPRELRRLWLPLVSLAVVAVFLTAAAVAWAGVALAGLPVAAAVVLGAIVAPPDAAAASTVLSKLGLPRRLSRILQGESLLNDAVALLIFGTALSAWTMSPGELGAALPQLLVAAPGGILLGAALAFVFLSCARWFAGTLSARVLEFVTTFSVWLIAERIGLSPILTVVAFAMTLAQYAPSRMAARDRVHSYSLWAVVVFVLNVLAFLLMGLQARSILARLGDGSLHGALGFAGIVLLIVIAVRLVWVMTYGFVLRRLIPLFPQAFPDTPVPTRRLGLVVSWCGMRGLVTLGTAFALPAAFPGRDLIALSAFAVVLGTLVLQGLTIVPLIRLLGIQSDRSIGQDLSAGRLHMIDAALASLAHETGPVVEAIRQEYEAERIIARNIEAPQADSAYDRLRRKAIAAQRERLAQLRRQGAVAEDVFQQLESELDWSEVGALPPDQLTLDDR